MKYHLTPVKETLKTNIIERTIGRVVSVEPSTRPFGPATADLLGDIFHATYNADMEPLEKKDVPRDRSINHALMNWMNQDEEFMASREKTKGKLAHSLLTTKFLYEYLITDDAIRRALEVQEKEPPEGPGDGEGEDMSDELADALAKLGKLSKNVIGSKIMSIGAKKAEEKADELDGAMKAWGLGPGDVNINNVDDIMKLVDEHDDKLKQISELAGRFQSVATDALVKTREAYVGQIVDTKRTRDFNLMYGTELCYLMSPDVPQLIRAKYKTDYLEAGLLGVEIRADAKDFGSVYVMVDGSGSMDGSLEIYAKAIAMGLVKALHQDTLNNRVYRLNTFGGGEGDNFYTTNSEEDWKSHFEWASLQQGGGTDFDWAFKRSIKDIAKMPEGTDLVFITDGSCSLSKSVMNQWIKFRQNTGTRLLYVDISGGNNQQIREICDLYILVDFSKDKIETIANDIASSLASNMEQARLEKKENEVADE